MHPKFASDTFELGKKFFASPKSGYEKACFTETIKVKTLKKVCLMIIQFRGREEPKWQKHFV